MKQFITFILTIIIAIAVYGGAIINSSIFDAKIVLIILSWPQTPIAQNQQKNIYLMEQNIWKKKD